MNDHPARHSSSGRSSWLVQRRSSFAHECHELLVAGRTGMFLLDAIGQNLLGIAAMAAGIALGAALRPA